MASAWSRVMPSGMLMVTESAFTDFVPEPFFAGGFDCPPASDAARTKTSPMLKGVLRIMVSPCCLSPGATSLANPICASARYAVCADEAFLAGSAGRALTAAAIDVSLQAILHSVGARRCRDAGAGAVASLAGAASCPGDHIRARSRLNARHGLETAL